MLEDSIFVRIGTKIQEISHQSELLIETQKLGSTRRRDIQLFFDSNTVHDIFDQETSRGLHVLHLNLLLCLSLQIRVTILLLLFVSFTFRLILCFIINFIFLFLLIFRLRLISFIRGGLLYSLR